MTPKAGGAGTVVSVNTSVKKGQIKRPVASVEIRAGRGIEGDAHQDFGHRQVSLLAVGDELVVAGVVRLRVSQIGKECHTRCAVYHLTGDCIMPARGIFCEVLCGGTVRSGDSVEKR